MFLAFFFSTLTVFADIRSWLCRVDVGKWDARFTETWMQNRKTILCYTPSPLPAQNLFFCGFHLDSLFNVQCGERPPPLLALKWKTFVEENAFWGNGVGGAGQTKWRMTFCMLYCPFYIFCHWATLSIFFIVFKKIMSPPPHITVTIEMAPMHDHWTCASFLY